MHTTQQDLQASSQELKAERDVVPTDGEVERRAILKRAGRTETRVVALKQMFKRLTAWQTLGLVAFWLAWPKAEAWGETHKEMSRGLVYLLIILVGGVVGATKLLRARSPEGDSSHGAESGHGGPPSGPP